MASTYLIPQPVAWELCLSGDPFPVLLRTEWAPLWPWVVSSRTKHLRPWVRTTCAQKLTSSLSSCHSRSWEFSPLLGLRRCERRSEVEMEKQAGLIFAGSTFTFFYFLTLFFLHISPISLSGWMTPISLLTDMMLTTDVSFRMAFSSISRQILPFCFTGK